MKKALYKILFIISILLIIGFGITLIIDWLNNYEYKSTPFYIYIIFRGIEFIIPSIIFFILSLLIRKKLKKSRRSYEK